MSTVSTEAQAVLDFWYPPDKPQKEQAKVWFGGKELDGVILEKFNGLVCHCIAFHLNIKDSGAFTVFTYLSGFIWPGKAGRKYQNLAKSGIVMEGQGSLRKVKKKCGTYSALSCHKLFFSKCINVVPLELMSYIHLCHF